MSDIVIGIATSHSPLLAIDPSLWAQRGEDDKRRKQTYLTDGRVLSYDELHAEIGDRHAGEATLENFERQSVLAQAMLDRLAAELAAAEPDILLIVGDDQEELFDKSHMPAIAVFTGDEIAMHPRGEVEQNLPEWRKASTEGYAMDAAHRYPAHPAFALHLVDRLIAEGVDLSIASRVEDPYKAGFGHAFGFVQKRLVGDRRIPIVPVMLNTYYPPNVPTPSRCYDIGAKLADAVRAWPGTERVAVIASGGMTHFMTDEPFDRGVLQAIAAHDAETLRTLPIHALRSGTSEILNWVVVAGAMQGLDVTLSEYIPVRRTPAGTGIGLGFVAWKPAN